MNLVSEMSRFARCYVKSHRHARLAICMVYGTVLLLDDFNFRSDATNSLIPVLLVNCMVAVGIDLERGGLVQRLNLFL